MIKYKKTFLSEIKSHLLYFFEFFNNKPILSKVYPYDYTMKSLNYKSIIIILYDKNIFFTNKSH